MLKLRIFIVVALLFGLTVSVSADDYIGLIQQGNKAFTESDYITASDFYHKAETELPESPEIEYNLAGAMYKQGKYEEAIERYTKALNSTDLNLEGQAHYNLGNTYYRMGDYQNAIKSYENSLKINPDDINAKFNLELARKMLKEQIKPEQQDQQQQQQQQEQKQEQQEQEENEEQQQQDQQQQDQQQQDQQEQQQKQQKQDEKEMSKEDAERILNALRDDERDIQKKIKRQVQAGDYSGKDW